MSLASLLKINFLTGVLGTLVSIPILYFMEVVRTVGQSEILHFGLIDVVMAVAAPLIAGIAFAVTGRLAYPIIRILQRRGILSEIL